MADRLPAQSAQSSQDAHEDLLAALAASRELGPEMDSALAERYLEKHGKPKAAQRNVQTQTSNGVPAVYQAMGAIMPLMGIAVYIVILIASQGALWWLFWLPMALGGGGWWWGGPHHGGPGDPRNDYRQARREARYQYRAWKHGYPYPYPPRNDEPEQVSAPSQRDARVAGDVL